LKIFELREISSRTLIENGNLFFRFSSLVVTDVSREAMLDKSTSRADKILGDLVFQEPEIPSCIQNENRLNKRVIELANSSATWLSQSLASKNAFNDSTS